jgi:hypothetical protein
MRHFTDQFILIAITYCRVYLNRQTAAMHHFVLNRIDAIVEADTGKSLQWRHIHASSASELTGILQWAGDQHGGQAKGAFLSLFSGQTHNVV